MVGWVDRERLTYPIIWGILTVEVMQMDSMSRMFIELPSFRLRWKSLGLSDDDLKKLVEILELELERNELT
jgi:hypothetical protein